MSVVELATAPLRHSLPRYLPLAWTRTWPRSSVAIEQSEAYCTLAVPESEEGR